MKLKAVVLVLSCLLGSVAPSLAQHMEAPARQVAGAQLASANTERGKQLYDSRCVACHSVDANRAGPLHRGVLGRKAGSVKGFDYSPALKKSTVIWTRKTLNAWLADPEKLVPGQAMGLSVSEAADRADLVAYLAGLK